LPEVVADGVTVTSCEPLAPDCKILCVARFVQVKNPVEPTGAAIHLCQFDPLHSRSTT